MTTTADIAAATTALEDVQTLLVQANTDLYAELGRASDRCAREACPAATASARCVALDASGGVQRVYQLLVTLEAVAAGITAWLSANPADAQAERPSLTVVHGGRQ